MSDGTVPEIDPRFDPRFQRGYVPDAAVPTPDPIPGHRPPDRGAPVTGFGDSRDTPQVPVATRGEAGESPNPVTETAGVTGAAAADAAADAGADDPALALREMLAQTQGERLDASGRDGRAGQDEAGTDAESVIDASPARWFWIAFAACVLFVVVGSVLYWVQTSDPSVYMGGGPRAGIDETVRVVVGALSPALVQAGVFGGIAVLLIWAVRGHRASGDER